MKLNNRNAEHIASFAAHQFLNAARRFGLRLKYNPNWHMQPRRPGGEPRGGQWVSYLLEASGSILPILQRLGPVAISKFKEVSRRLAPVLRRLPRRWNNDLQPTEDSYDGETRRISQNSWQRRGEPNIRFRNERELRNYLGPAGNGREWHHIVEKRLAGRPGFPPEQIHSTDNIISLPIEVHRRISARMSSGDTELGGAVRRNWMENLEFGTQYNMGLEIIEDTLKDFGYDPARF